jgi:hypothetical protein
MQSPAMFKIVNFGGSPPRPRNRFPDRRLHRRRTQNVAKCAGGPRGFVRNRYRFPHSNAFHRLQLEDRSHSSRTITGAFGRSAGQLILQL